MGGGEEGGGRSTQTWPRDTSPRMLVGEERGPRLTPSSPSTTPGQGLSLPEAIGGANPTHPHSQLGGWASLRCHPGFALRLHHLPVR